MLLTPDIETPTSCSARWKQWHICILTKIPATHWSRQGKRRQFKCEEKADACSVKNIWLREVICITQCISNQLQWNFALILRIWSLELVLNLYWIQETLWFFNFFCVRRLFFTSHWIIPISHLALHWERKKKTKQNKNIT